MITILVFVITFAASSSWAAKPAPSPDIIPIPGGFSGPGITTRYWDCCKPACSWSGNLPNKTKTPVRSCAIDGITVVDEYEMSGCAENGTSYTCNNQSPWNVNATLAYGFAGFSHTGGAYLGKCCSCMLLKFQGKLLGKSMVVQVTNTGTDGLVNHFDIAIPGGGVGIFNGCTKQFKAPTDGWGDRYGGVHSREECDNLPKVLSDKCKWRFDFMGDVSNPPVEFLEVECPKEITDVSGCYP